MLYSPTVQLHTEDGKGENRGASQTETKEQLLSPKPSQIGYSIPYPNTNIVNARAYHIQQPLVESPADVEYNLLALNVPSIDILSLVAEVMPQLCDRTQEVCMSRLL